MSKRNRNKFRNRETANRSEDRVSQSHSPAAAYSGAQGVGQVAEYRIIRADLIRLVVLNAIMLGLVLFIYFTNLHSGYLERIFMKLFKI